MSWKIPLFKSYWEEDDIQAVTKIIKRGTFWATGPEIEEFEERIASFIGRKYCVSFNSGTSALYTMLLAYEINSGEVIVPSFTFISTSNAVILSGAKPVFAETEDETYGLDFESVKNKINNNTKAIIPIHYGGLGCRDINLLKDFAKEENILLLEDAAESLGSKVNGKMVGCFGDSAMFSFCQNKVITTGEGGVILTNEREIYEKMKLLRSHGRVEEKSSDYFSTTKSQDYVQIGYNFRMPTMLASLGISQLSKIDKTIKMRRANADYLNNKLKNISDLKLPIEKEDQFHVYQMYTIQCKDKKSRNGLQEYLNRKGIMSKIYFDPVHLKTFYKRKYNYKKGDLPKTEELSKKVLTIPMYASMSKEELNYLSDSIISNFKGR